MADYLYVEIAEALEAKIKAGVYKVHQKLPSENDLARQFETSRLTVRKAINLLEKQKIVVHERNKGTYVLADVYEKISSGKSGLIGFTEAAKQRQLNVSTKVLEVRPTMEYASDVKSKLGLQDEEWVWKIRRLRLADDEPMTYESIYLKQQVVPLLSTKEAEGSLFKLIEKTTTISYAKQELEAVLLDFSVSELLETTPDKPAFLAHTIAYSIDGYPILYDDSYYRADKYTFHNILYREH